MESRGGHSETLCGLSAWVGESKRGGEARPWKLEVYSLREGNKMSMVARGKAVESPRFVATVNCQQAGVLPLLLGEATARRS